MQHSSSFLVLAALVFPGGLLATEYVVPGGSVSKFFSMLPADATYISFSAAAEYSTNEDIVLPARNLIIDGKGCHLILGPNSNGFTCEVTDQKDATRRISTRYVIKDFGEIEGGKHAIDLKATLGSIVSDVKVTRQSEAGIEFRFCLMGRLQNVLVTNPVGKGIVIRQGDWLGASASNSQSNSTVLEQCRINCASTTTDAFTVLNSGGVRMTDCVSEGGPCDHDLFLSATTDGDEAKFATNTVVKSFTLSNFHVEHKARLASVYVNMPSKCAVNLSNIYWNGEQTAPVILYTMGQLNLSDIGWWNPDFRIRTRISAPRMNITRCHSALDVGGKEEKTAVRAGSFELKDAIEGNTELKLNYIRVTDRSM